MSISVAEVKQGMKVAKALMRFAYTADHDEFAEVVYHRECDDYTWEKFQMMQHHLVHYLGALDDAHLAAFVEAALDHLARVG